MNAIPDDPGPAAPQAGPWRDRNLVVFANSTMLPDVCMRCGRPAADRHSVALR